METEPQLIKDYVATGKARLVYRHLYQLGDASRYLAEATECAGAQGAFWEMREAIYRQYDGLGSASTYADVAPLVRELGLDETNFAQCMDSGQFVAQVEKDAAQSQREGITSRPVMDINGTRLVGALSVDRYRQVLDAVK